MIITNYDIIFTLDGFPEPHRRLWIIRIKNEIRVHRLATPCEPLAAGAVFLGSLKVRGAMVSGVVDHYASQLNRLQVLYVLLPHPHRAISELELVRDG